jgi:hypothetical protein
MGPKKNAGQEIAGDVREMDKLHEASRKGGQEKKSRSEKEGDGDRCAHSWVLERSFEEGEGPNEDAPFDPFERVGVFLNRRLDGGEVFFFEDEEKGRIIDFFAA